MSLDFDLTSKRIRNLKVLQSINVNVLEIVEDVSHVALYKYETFQGAKWERVDVEGSAFITRNKESPFYSLIILNKKGPTDFVLDLTSKIKVKVQEIYVMLRCNAEVIFGLWFHNEEERSNLFQSLKRITASEGNGNGAFTASLLKLQAQTASRDSPSSKEPAEKLKYSEIVSKSNNNNSKPPSASAPVSGSNSPLSSSTNNVSPSSSSTAKKNMLLSALKPSASETELKDKAVNANSSVESKPVGLSMSENNLGRLLLEGISSKKQTVQSIKSDNVNDVKKVLFTDVSTAKSNNASNGIAAALVSPNPNVESGNGSDEDGMSSGSARLLSLLKSSGRTSTASSGSSPVGLSTSRDSPVQQPIATITPDSTKSAPAVMTEAERSDRLLSMLKHATTSNQAMELLTDGDIAARQPKSTGEPLTKSASSNKLLSMLKTPIASNTNSPVPIASDKASTVDVGAKENLSRNSLAVSNSTVSPASKTTADISPASVVATPASTLSNEERTIQLLSSLASTPAIKKSPELRPMNSIDSVTSNGKPPSPSTVATNLSASSLTAAPKLTRPVTLLSPSDLLKLAV